jgi:lipopolysaccharide/colanic/teichoic acid biosynthesis glycosyltransferase
MIKMLAAKEKSGEIAHSYRPCTKWEKFLERGIGIFLSALLALPAVVFLLPLYFLYLATIRDGGGFLYRGGRLGLGKRMFTIYKVRSLKTGAESRIKSALHQGGSSEELWYGNLIRRTRLDELPQLYNVLRGDMDFVGPRPERLEVYEDKLRFMPGYDLRFLVKPGLTGLSQLITPHSTPKRIRVAIDNRYFVRHRSPVLKYLLFLRTIRAFAYKVFCEGMKKISEFAILIALVNPRKNRRANKRYFPKDLYCSINILMGIDPRLQRIITDILTNEFRVRNLNRTEVLVEGKRESVGALLRCMQWEEGAARKEEDNLELKLQLNRLKGVKTKVVNCSGSIRALRSGQRGGNRQILLTFKGKSEIDKYFIDKYILKESFT